MSQTKFRGKRKDNKKWPIGYYIVLNNKHWIVPIREYQGFTEKCRLEDFAAEVFPETVCQFTGLLDKNGKEGYKSDIITNPDSEYLYVDWNEVKGQWYAYSDNVVFHNPIFPLFSALEIGWFFCGDIHENSELLK